MSSLASNKNGVEQLAADNGHRLGSWQTYTDPGGNPQQDGESAQCICGASAVVEKSGAVILTGGEAMREPCTAVEK